MIRNLVLACALLGIVACGKGDKVVDRPTPQDSAARFTELAARMSRQDFNLLYEYDDHSGAKQQQFVWIQVQGKFRWDNVTLRTALSGQSVINLGKDEGSSCRWATNDEKTSVSGACFPEPNDLYGGLIDGLFEYPTNMRFVGFENRLGHDLECYSPVTFAGETGKVCVTDQGLPLILDVKGLNSRLSLAALEIRDVPQDDEWLRPVTDVGSEDLQIRDLPIEQLRLPPVPLAHEVLRPE